MKRGARWRTTRRRSLAPLCFALLASLTLILDAGLAVAKKVSEEELIRAYLRGGAERAVAASARARRRAAGLTRPYLPKPGLLLRREQSFGAATEFSTTVAGVSLSLEIGGRYAMRKRAAALDMAAMGLQRRANLVETLCDLRRRAQAAHAEQQVVSLLSASQLSLDKLPVDLKRLVSAGERASFDLDRMQLLLRTRRQKLGRRRARLEAMLLELSALTGLDVSAIGLPARLSSKKQAPAAEEAPALQALRKKAEAEAQRVAEARRRWVPNFDLYAGYRLDMAAGGATGHGYELGLNLNLPITASQRVAQGVAEATRKTLLARATRQQALRAARLKALGGKARELERALSGSPGDPDKLMRDVKQRYLSGVGSLSELVDTLRAVNEAALQRARTEAELRRVALEAACLRGVFDEESINKLLKEETP